MMQLSAFFFTASLALIHLPIATAQTPTQYVTGYPICDVAGFTEVPGNYNETIEKQSGSDLQCCLDQCRQAYPACQSIAFNPRYTECLFFDRVVEETQLENNTDSDFFHYDLPCYVE